MEAMVSCIWWCCQCCCPPKHKPKRNDNNNQKTKKDNHLALPTDELRNQTVKCVIIDENSDKISRILMPDKSTIDSNVNESDDKLLIEEQRLEFELKLSVKGGDDTYETVVDRHRSISGNDKSQIDVKPAELAFDKQFMSSKHYTVSELIGSGNYANIYKARDAVRHRTVSLKVIHTTDARLKHNINNFIARDVSIISKLNHQNVCKTYEMIRSANKIYVVSELCSRGTVAEWLRTNGTFSEYMTWCLMRAITDGLCYMHDKRLAHRNLKVDNILLTDSLQPMITDYTYSMIVDPKLPKCHAYRSGIYYLSPEILQRLPYSPYAADIWALGICLYVMVNNKVPFWCSADEPDEQILAKILTNKWMFRPEVADRVSPDLSVFVRFLLDMDVERRPETSVILKHHWIVNTPNSAYNCTNHK